MTTARVTKTAVRPVDAKIAALKMDGVNNVQIAKEVKLTRKTVQGILEKPAVRQLLMDAFAENGFTLKDLAKKNIEMLSAKREILANKRYMKVDDNVTQVTAMKEMNQIYGVYAPKQLDIRASASEASLEELIDQADTALEELDMVAEQPASFIGNDSTE